MGSTLALTRPSAKASAEWRPPVRATHRHANEALQRYGEFKQT